MGNKRQIVTLNNGIVGLDYLRIVTLSDRSFGTTRIMYTRACDQPFRLAWLIFDQVVSVACDVIVDDTPFLGDFLFYIYFT